MSAPVDVRSMQARYFELLRKRRFFDLYYVASEQEAGTLYVREEGGKHYPSRALLSCPDPADQAEMVALEASIEASGVRMYL